MKAFQSVLLLVGFVFSACTLLPESRTDDITIIRDFFSGYTGDEYWYLAYDSRDQKLLAYGYLGNSGEVTLDIPDNYLRKDVTLLEIYFIGSYEGPRTLYQATVREFRGVPRGVFDIEKEPSNAYESRPNREIGVLGVTEQEYDERYFYTVSTEYAGRMQLDVHNDWSRNDHTDWVSLFVPDRKLSQTLDEWMYIEYRRRSDNQRFHYWANFTVTDNNFEFYVQDDDFTPVVFDVEVAYSGYPGAGGLRRKSPNGVIEVIMETNDQGFKLPQFPEVFQEYQLQTGGSLGGQSHYFRSEFTATAPTQVPEPNFVLEANSPDGQMMTAEVTSGEADMLVLYAYARPESTSLYWYTYGDAKQPLETVSYTFPEELAVDMDPLLVEGLGARSATAIDYTDTEGFEEVMEWRLVQPWLSKTKPYHSLNQNLRQ